jgi:hypothetical protein
MAFCIHSVVSTIHLYYQGSMRCGNIIDLLILNQLMNDMMTMSYQVEEMSIPCLVCQ